MKILIAEDDPVTLEAVDACLSGEGFETVLARNGREALSLWEQQDPALVCLDIMMPEVDGFEVCRKIRAKDSAVPVMFLSAKNEEIDVVVGLELGADDFIRKPFGKRELLARVNSALRRGNAGKERKSFAMGDLEVFPRELCVEKSGSDRFDITPREAAILCCLHKRRGEAVSRETLSEECWGLDYFPESRTLDQHIVKLRRKIEDDPAHPKIIETIRGIGYRFR